MTKPTLPRVLLVDDEPRVLDGLTLTLRKEYEVHLALSAEEGLRKLKELRGVHVVVSDMRMPGMDGATFLRQVMRSFPDVSRLLLTGETGRDAAVMAINEGQILRFLTKPCPPEQLKAAIEAGVMHHRLMNAERSILHETLIGCIQALTDVLAITNPVAFGRAARVKRLAMKLAAALGCEGYWQLEAAAMLSQLGYLSLPVELVEKLYYAEALTPEEKTLAEGVPAVANKLLGHIPRLEPVVQILDALVVSNDQLYRLGDGTIGLGARILGLVLTYDALVAQRQPPDAAMQSVRGTAARFGSALIEKFAEVMGAASASEEVREIELHLVKPGMTILQDVRTHLGTLLVARGYEVSEPFIERLRNFGPTLLAEKVKVMMPAVRR